MHCRPDVVEYCEIAEEADILKRARDAETIDFESLLAVDALSPELNGTIRGFIDAGYEIETSGFACTVWSDKPDDFIFMNGEGDITEGT